MRYRLSLAERQRHASNKRRQYWTDAEYRLACINAARARRGAPPIASLDDMGDPKRGRAGAPRDSNGRFLAQAQGTAGARSTVPGQRG